MPVLVRPATPDDADAMRRVYLAAGREAWAHFLPAEQVGANATELSGDRGFVAEEGGEVVGFAWLRGSELDTLYTDPRVWGRGAGRALMDAALAGPAGGDAVDRGAEHARTPRLRAVRLAAGRRQAREDVCGRHVHRAAVQDCARGSPMTLDPYTLPDNLPVPEDDGAADHLTGVEVPGVVLESSHGPVDVSTYTVVYVYPRTGKPGVPSLPGWDEFPGARGCTPQSCSFRDHATELAELGATVAGLSAQTLDDQLEFAGRNHMPYPVIADPELRLRDALRLPTFEIAGHTLYKRLAWIARGGRIVKVFYPVFPPDRNAGDVVDWLRRNPG